MSERRAIEPMNEACSIRVAREEDGPELERLIRKSVHGLQAYCYSAAQREAALGPVFGVDRQLIADGTFLVVEHDGHIVGCGGWSRRRAEFGADGSRPAGQAVVLDPTREPARLRAFFVDPDWARRGLGRAIVGACESALREAGFREAILVATLAGEPLYASCGYRVAERDEIPLSAGLTLPVVRMFKKFPPSHLSP